MLTLEDQEPIILEGVPIMSIKTRKKTRHWGAISSPTHINLSWSFRIGA
jgi:hypothetical protein